MNQIVPFTPRPPDGDWSPIERARLAELAERLRAQGARVSAAYGVSDEGDPWCVIEDDQEEVLIHIARIDGAFVVHEAADDAVRRSETLWGALKRLFGAVGDAAVVQLDARKAQILLAVLMVALFVDEAAREGQAIREATAPEPDHAPAAAAAESNADHPSADAEDSLAADQRTPTAPGEAGAASGPEPHPAKHPPGAGAVTAAAGTTSGLTLAPPAAAEVVAEAPATASLAEADRPSPATLAGETPMELAVLEGTSGPDQLRLGTGVVARGGGGDDVFVLDAQTAAPGFGVAGTTAAAPATQGVILDFSAGDRLVFASGGPVTIVSVTPVTDVLNGATARDLAPGATPGVRIGVDVNGDGTADTYLLVAGPGAAGLASQLRPSSGISEPPDDQASIGSADLGGVAPPMAEPPGQLLLA